MKTILFLQLSLLLLFFSCNDRSPSRPGSGSGTGSSEPIVGPIAGVLEREKSPFRVTGDILVERGTELAIAAGVELIFEKNSRLIVYGVLRARGSQNAPIRFQSADTTWRGIHIQNSSGKSILEFCIIEDVHIIHSDSPDKGALNVEQSEVEVRNTIFRNNVSEFGGGISLTGNARAVIKNNIFYANHCVVYGGGIFALQSTTEIVNNTFYKNYCQNVGGGLVLYHPVGVEIQNNIFYKNTGGSGNPGITFLGDTTGIIQQYNFFPEVNEDPRFVLETDLHLQAVSPCIDAGNPDPVFNDVDGSRNDQGAYGGPGGGW